MHIFEFAIAAMVLNSVFANQHPHAQNYTKENLFFFFKVFCLQSL